MQDTSDHWPTVRRTSAAIGIAAAAGVPAGLFLHVTAVPFGPVLLGLAMALVGAIVGTAVLCVVATDRYVTVGVAYAASLAVTTVIASIAASGWGNSWWGPLEQFGAIFSITAFASLFGSLPVAVLKWEDKRARQKNEQAVALDQDRRTESSD